MLSRTANGLFWMSRYVERAENIARLIDAGRRIEALPGIDSEASSEWASITIAAGCRETFPYDLEYATRAQVAEHLIFDPENPSSIRASMDAARENARALRGALSREVWEAINGSWRWVRGLGAASAEGGGLARLLDEVLSSSFHLRGAIEATLLRDERLGFIELGKFIERIDATARLLDVKYNVLLPESTDIGRGLDLMQWQQILRAANSLRAYRHIYREHVSAKGVVDLLVINKAAPRSLARGYEGVCEHLERIGLATEGQQAVFRHAKKLHMRLNAVTASEIIQQGLHEWLTEIIIDTNLLAIEIGDAFGFGKPVVPDALPEADEAINAQIAELAE